MENSLLLLIRGILVKRTGCNEKERAVFEHLIYSMLTIVLDLQRFQAERGMKRDEDLDTEQDGQRNEIMLELQQSVHSIKEGLREHPLGNPIHMDVILRRLNAIKNAYEPQQPIEKPALSTAHSSQMDAWQKEEEESEQTESLVLASEQEEEGFSRHTVQSGSFENIARVRKKKQTGLINLPPLTGFVMVKEGVFIKGESNHGRAKTGAHKRK
ncbi:hypothetical protein ACFQZE_04050 [Paenibacillus sp. GCM10027627]